MRQQVALCSLNQCLFGLVCLMPGLAFPANCGEPATLISKVQGTGGTSPLQGKPITIEAIVTGTFQGAKDLGGFFVQEEPRDNDRDISTAEGVFIYHRATPVQPGQLIRVSGIVTESYGLTQLTHISLLEKCVGDHRGTIKPTTLAFPIGAAAQLETLEAMLVSINEKTLITDIDKLDRFGEYAVSGTRRYVPTQIVPPGPAAVQLSQSNQNGSLIVNDSTFRAKSPRHTASPGNLSAKPRLRSGQVVTSIVGVLNYAYHHYRIHTTEVTQFEELQLESITPPKAGQLRLASFNIDNYFNGDGRGGGFPTARAAKNPEQLQRQGLKLGQTIARIDAHIIGIAELENDGYAKESALSALVNASNAFTQTAYQFVKLKEERNGRDVISVGILYRPDLVQPKGDALTLSRAPFGTLNRSPLAQMFQVNHSQTNLMVIMNHFKSKNCTGAKGPDTDHQDGQACFNATRVAAAKELAAWARSISTTPNIVLLGDFNSYAQEDPVQTLRDAGFSHAIAAENYSFVYQGQAGTLDYAFYSQSLAPFVVNTGIWHINADEPASSGYLFACKSGDGLPECKSDTVYRSSDHDPVYIDIRIDDTELKNKLTSRAESP